VVAEIQDAGGGAIALQADVSQDDRVLAMFQQFYDAFGTVDILVNNAGLQLPAKPDAFYHYSADCPMLAPCKP